ncbi:MAG: site-2 protease family protein [Candidatus Helarchaeota archaeon]
MSTNNEEIRVIDKIKRIITKYYKIEIFKEDKYRFEPLCIVKIGKTDDVNNFKQLQEDFKKIGYKIYFHELTKKEYEKYEIQKENDIKKYQILFEAKLFKRDGQKSRRFTKKTMIQLVLLGITISMVVLSAWFYLTYIEPYFGNAIGGIYNSIISMITFCIGMLLIIIVHEFGHYFISRYHKLDASLPYLIPGPPPIGMLGAFVSIRDDPRTRNEKFDVTIGGIILGILISIVLSCIGLLLSKQVDINIYLTFRANYFNKSITEMAEFVHNNLNSYNLLFLGFRYLFFKPTTFSYHYGYYLPDKILVIHPLAFTGWIGLLISGLNLLPISFLDGGHAFTAIFPYKYTKLIGLGISAIILLYLDPYMLFFIVLGLSGALNDLNQNAKRKDIPYPPAKFTKSRKIIALSLVFIFIILFPLSFDNLLYGIGY